jgi:glutaminyl-tRNA synthetase
LFSREDPDELGNGIDLRASLNPNSLEALKGCRVEPGLASAAPGTQYQFERQGYFCVDSDSSEEAQVFNRTVSLRDTWAKIEKKGEK